jgi:hypothetical protein
MPKSKLPDTKPRKRKAPKAKPLSDKDVAAEALFSLVTTSTHLVVCQAMFDLRRIRHAHPNIQKAMDTLMQASDLLVDLTPTNRNTKTWDAPPRR